MSIRFGTSGWRAVIADEFTYANVGKATRAICRYLKTEGTTDSKTLIIGHDSRFMGERFSAFAGGIAATGGFRVLLCSGPTPTPAISFAIRDQKACGAINFTASHNPPEYQGIKFSTADGAPALPEITGKIEALVEGDLAINGGGGSVEEFNPQPAYLDDLRKKVHFSLIENSNGKFAYDPLWGTGRGYLDEILQKHGLEVETLHDWRDVTFGGRSPEPGQPQLEELRRTVIEKKLSLGVATDGDADRFGIIDSGGEFITPNQLVALLTDYLAESRGWQQGAARSVATSHLVDRVVKSRGLKLYETPVGFKYIGELINRDEIILGGEESAGLSIRGHYPEKDGILACLLAIEAAAARNASLTEQLEELYGRIGRLESGRIGVKLTDEVASGLKEKLSRDVSEIGGRRIEKIIRIDGVKFILSGDDWILMRPSGTEPLVRIYAESESKGELEKLLNIGRNYLLS